ATANSMVSAATRRWRWKVVFMVVGPQEAAGCRRWRPATCRGRDPRPARPGSRRLRCRRWPVDWLVQADRRRPPPPGRPVAACLAGGGGGSWAAWRSPPRRGGCLPPATSRATPARRGAVPGGPRATVGGSARTGGPVPARGSRARPGRRRRRGGSREERRVSSPVLQLLLQRRAGARQVGLDRALAAAHHLGGGGHVQLFKYPQSERLALPRGQAGYRL